MPGPGPKQAHMPELCHHTGVAAAGSLITPPSPAAGWSAPLPWHPQLDPSPAIHATRCSSLGPSPCPSQHSAPQVPAGLRAARGPWWPPRVLHGLAGPGRPLMPWLCGADGSPEHLPARGLTMPFLLPAAGPVTPRCPGHWVPSSSIAGQRLLRFSSVAPFSPTPHGAASLLTGH